MDKILEIAGTSTALIAAVDIDEDGKLDILCQKYSASDSVFDLKFIYNNKYLDSFFLKSLMVFKQQEIDEESREILSSDDEERMLGDMAIGASIRFVTTNIAD